MPTLHHGNVKLNYEVVGEGEPLILITGLGGDTSFWNGLVSLLSNQYRVITLDNRGAGQTEYGGMAFNIQDMASDIAAILDRLGIRRSHVLGWSMAATSPNDSQSNIRTGQVHWSWYPLTLEGLRGPAWPSTP